MSLKLAFPKPRKPRKIGYLWTGEGCTEWKSYFTLADQKTVELVDMVYWDKLGLQSGVEPNRVEYNKLNKSLRKGDTLVVPSLDHLETSIFEVLDTIYTLHTRGIHLKVLRNYIDTSTDESDGLFCLCDALMCFLEHYED